MINAFLFVVFIFMLFMIVKSDIYKLVCILFVHLSSISLENFKDRAFDNSGDIGINKTAHLNTFGLVYIEYKKRAIVFVKKKLFLNYYKQYFILSKN